jgi:malonyl-CoA/methylmalonyl-CoA synthetase
MATSEWLAGSGDEMCRNLADLLDRRLAREKAAFTCDDGRRFSGESFWNLSGRLANWLRSAGIKPGDRVALHVEKSVEALALFWACVRGGYIYLPLNSAYTLAEVSYFVGDAEPRVLVCMPREHSDFARRFGDAGILVLSLGDAGDGNLIEAIEPISGDHVDHVSEWDDVAAILYTSGTTGKSKGAMLTHGNLASNALALIDAWRFTNRDVLIHALPVFHTHGLFVATNTVLLSGGSMLFRRKFDAADVLSLMPSATVLMGVPTFYTRLLQHDGLTHDCCRNTRLFVSGSAPLLAETHRAFAQRTGHAILERYGMTETNMNTSNPYDGARRAGTVGLPLPFIDVRITDLGSGRLLASSETGMIELKGPNLFRGYWRNPEKTAEDMTPDGFFRTGDVGHVDEQRYLVITGRAKDLIITGGYNVYPKEIEELIDALPGVLESAVIGLQHRDFGEAVTAVVVLKPNERLDESAILSAIQGSLARFKQPKRVLVVDSLPRNPMGKVQKAALRQTYTDLYRPV